MAIIEHNISLNLTSEYSISEKVTVVYLAKPNPSPTSRILTCILVFTLLLVGLTLKSRAQDIGSLAENLWSEINFEKIEKDVSFKLKLSKTDSVLFFRICLPRKLESIRDIFFQDFSSGFVNQSNLSQYYSKLIKRYLYEYQKFIDEKDALSSAINLGGNISNLRSEAVNGPCTNMDFTQNFTGWTGAIRNRNTTTNNANPTTGPIQTGFLEHCIMTPAMSDPYIPTLRVVPPLPAPQSAVRLGNVVSGGQLATISQTFLVSPNNLMLTYRYAVVLEDPKGANNHEGLKAPYFSAILTDQNGDTIRCAKYSVIVQSKLQGFILGCESPAFYMNAGNWGCPTGAAGYDGSGLYGNVAAVTNPIDSVCPNNSRALYYKNWTTVSIPLVKYLGQNVTMTFTASDCLPGAHLGYAYVQAECAPLPLRDPGYICSGKQKKTLTAPIGFETYKWSGPGIVGASNTRSIIVNKSGTYQMILTPLSDLPCPDTEYVYLREHCPPPAIADTVCESSVGSGSVSGIDITSFDKTILGTFVTATVISWHKSLPAGISNKIGVPNNVTVVNGSLFYAIITYPMPVKDSIPIPNDTVALSFLVNNKPKIIFPPIPASCIGSPAFQISGVTPVGGLFSGIDVTQTGVFDPISVGSFTIQYYSKTAQGCADSITKVALVKPKPAVITIADTSICYKNTLINLPISAHISADSMIWNTTYGKIANVKDSTTNLSISGAAPLEKNILVIGAAFRKSCAPVYDTIKIVTHQLPAIDAHKDTVVCTMGGTINMMAKGSVHYQDSVHWSSSNAGFTNRYVLNPSVTLNSTYPIKTSFKLILVAFKETCPIVEDSFIVTVNPFPKVQAPNDSSYCANAANIILNGSNKGTDSLRWSISNFSGNFSNTNLPATIFIRPPSSVAGYAIFTLTGYTKKCGIDTSSVKISLEAMPSVIVTADSVCKNNPVVTASAKIKQAAGVNWTAGGGTFSPNDKSTTVQYQPVQTELNQRNVFFKATTLPSIGQLCPMVSDSINVSIYLPPSLKLPSDTTVCFPKEPTNLALTSVLLNADSLVWNTSNSLIPSPKKGTNTVLGITNNSSFKVIATAYKRGCKPVKDSLNVILELPPKITATATPTCLPNLQADLVGTSTIAGTSSTGIWTSSGIGSFISNTNILSANSYLPSKQDSANKTVNLTLTSTGQVHCQKRDTTIKWSVIPLPMASAGIDSTVCVNSSIKRNTKSNTDWTYEWKLVKNGTIVSSTPNVLFSATKDTNNLYLTVTNSISCLAVDSVKITTVIPPTIALIPKICLYSPTIVTATITNPPALGTYSWTRNGNTLPISTNTLLLDTATTYLYHYQYNGGCKASATITALGSPKLKVQDTSACLNGSTQFIANRIAGASYYWGPNAVSNGTNKFPINAGNGISNYKVLVVDANGCRDSVLSKIDVFPYPTFSLTGSDICPGQANKLKATLTSPSLSSIYTLSRVWLRNGQEIPSANWQELSYNQAGNYSLTLGIKGCKATQAKLVSDWPTPKIDMPLSYKRCYETDPPLLLQANSFVKYSWTSDGLLIDTTQSIQVSPEKDTYYLLSVENTFGCLDSARILVRKVCPPRLFVPNVITPASQDVNAALRIFGAHYTNFEITIFSRWGEIIFNSKDPKNAWDGVYKSENMPIGNYQWQVTYEGDTEEYKGPFKKTGDVTVVR